MSHHPFFALWTVGVSVACGVWTAVSLTRMVRIYRRYLRLLAKEQAKLEAIRREVEAYQFERESVRRMVSAAPEESTIRALTRWCWQVQDHARARAAGLLPQNDPQKGPPS